SRIDKVAELWSYACREPEIARPWAPHKRWFLRKCMSYGNAYEALRPATPRPDPGVRGRRPQLELHQGGGGVASHPVGHQPPDPGPGGEPGRGPVRAPAAHPGADPGGPDALPRGRRDARSPAGDRGPPAGERRRPAPHRQHHGWVRLAVADSAPAHLY